MNPFRLQVEPELVRRTVVVWMFINEVYWACLVFASSSAASADSIAMLAVVIAVGAAAAGWRAGASIADGARVLGTLCAPRALWHAWVRKVATSLALRVGLAIVAGTVAVMQHGATWAWSGPAALYSVLVLVVLLMSLAHHMGWHWAWSWGGGALIAVAMGVLGWPGLTAWMQGAASGHLVLALASAGATGGLLWRWRRQAPAPVGAREDKPRNPLQHCANYVRRFTYLNPQRLQLPTSKGKHWTALAIMMPLGYVMATRVNLLKAQWGHPAGLIYLGSLVILMSFIHTTVACKDLHWRRLLAPQGFNNGGLGWHIIVSTLEVNLGIVAVFAALAGIVVIVLGWAGIHVDVAAYARAAAPFGVVVAEYVMAICVAVAMRTIRRPMIVYLGLFVVAGFLVTNGLARIGVNPWHNFFVIGPTYLASLAVIAIVATLIANRFWTTQRLLPYIATPAVLEDEAGEGGRWFPWPGRPY